MRLPGETSTIATVKNSFSAPLLILTLAWMWLALGRLSVASELATEWTGPEVQGVAFTQDQQAEIDRRIAAALDDQLPTTSGLAYGYDNGFVFASPSGLSVGVGRVPFAMRINSWNQMRHTVFDSQSANPDQNDFEFERLRLTFGGHAYTPDLRYFLQLDGDSDQASRSDWLDYYITYDVGHHLWECEQGLIGIKIGKWKLPFNRTRAEAGWKLQFTDRSMASSFFDINRSQGIALYGKRYFCGRTVNWESAVFNGFKTGDLLPGRRDLDRNFGYASRLWTDWIGDWGKDGEADLSCHTAPAVRIGTGFAYATQDREGQTEFSGQRVVDSGDTLVSLLPASVTAYEVFFYSADLNLKYRGFSLHSEFYARQLQGFRGGAIDELWDHGFLVQTGQFVVASSVELIARWSRIEGDSGTLGMTSQSADEVAGGIVWYMNGQFAKLTFDVTHLDGSPTRDLALNILNGDAGWLYRTQFQLRF